VPKSGEFIWAEHSERECVQNLVSHKLLSKIMRVTVLIAVSLKSVPNRDQSEVNKREQVELK